ncbi:MAG TPA: hypothetical protein VMS82_04575 [Pseudolabrys sp.]|nr:hypothetical protein [Pseudolabrys sp.]
MSKHPHHHARDSRPKDGALLLAYVAGIRVFKYFERAKTWMPGTRPGMTE